MIGFPQSGTLILICVICFPLSDTLFLICVYEWYPLSGVSMNGLILFLICVIGFPLNVSIFLKNIIFMLADRAIFNMFMTSYTLLSSPTLAYIFLLPGLWKHSFKWSMPYLGEYSPYQYSFTFKALHCRFHLQKADTTNDLLHNIFLIV